MRKLALPSLLLLFFVVFSSQVLGQSSFGVAGAIPFAEADIPNGSVICEGETGFQVCSEEYSPKTYGVVVLTPEVGFVTTQTHANVKPVVTQGTALVRVSSVSGPIKTGDYVSASSIPGVAQKSMRSGYALGIAQGDWNETNPEVVGTILVSVQPKPAILTARASANLIQLIKEGIDATYLSPVLTLRYTLAALLTVSSVIVGFWFFGRSAHSGIQAIGRNPLAGRTILFAISFNVFITLGIMAAGIFVAYLLLVS